MELHTPVALGAASRSLAARGPSGGFWTRFEVFVQPQFLERPTSVRSIGFDEMLISADPGLDMQLIDVALGTEEEFASGAPQSLLDLASTDGQDAARRLAPSPSPRGRPAAIPMRCRSYTSARRTMARKCLPVSTASF